MQTQSCGTGERNDVWQACHTSLVTNSNNIMQAEEMET